jgi:hypothetical protein
MEGRSICVSLASFDRPAGPRGQHGDRPRRYLPPVRVLSVSVTGALAALAASLVISTQAATGLEPGVHVDPGSPAAKQYALPLNQAREIGRGGAGPGASASPLFGAGIGNARSHRSTVAAKGTGPDGRAGAGSGAGAAEPRRLPHGGSSSDRSALASLDASHLDIAAHEGSGDGSLLALLGGGIVVLLLGGAGGVAVRRVGRSTPPA